MDRSYVADEENAPEALLCQGQAISSTTDPSWLLWFNSIVPRSLIASQKFDLLSNLTMKSTKSTNFKPKFCKSKAHSVSSIDIWRPSNGSLPMLTRQIVTARIASDRRVLERALHYSCNCERGSSILSLSLFFFWTLATNQSSPRWWSVEELRSLSSRWLGFEAWPKKWQDQNSEKASQFPSQSKFLLRESHCSQLHVWLCWPSCWL